MCQCYSCTLQNHSNTEQHKHRCWCVVTETSKNVLKPHSSVYVDMVWTQVDMSHMHMHCTLISWIVLNTVYFHVYKTYTVFWCTIRIYTCTVGVVPSLPGCSTASPPPSKQLSNPVSISVSNTSRKPTMHFVQTMSTRGFALQAMVHTYSNWMSLLSMVASHY